MISVQHCQTKAPKPSKLCNWLKTVNYPHDDVHIKVSILWKWQANAIRHEVLAGTFQCACRPLCHAHSRCQHVNRQRQALVRCGISEVYSRTWNLAEPNVILRRWAENQLQLLVFEHKLRVNSLSHSSINCVHTRTLAPPPARPQCAGGHV